MKAEDSREMPYDPSREDKVVYKDDQNSSANNKANEYSLPDDGLLEEIFSGMAWNG